MSKLVGKAGKKLFERHLQQYAPEDPVYEYYTDAKGKQKRRKVRFQCPLKQFHKPLNSTLPDSHIFRENCHPGFPLAMLKSCARSRAAPNDLTRDFLSAASDLAGHSSSVCLSLSKLLECQPRQPLGLIPVVGDFADIILNYLIVI